MQEQIFKDLEKIGTKFSKIEIELGMPKNYLSRFKNPNNKLPEKWVTPLSDFIKKHNNKEVMGGYEISQTIDLPKEEKHTVTFNGPQILPDWAKKIEDYCGTAGITPEELIEQHSKKTTKATRSEAEKPSDDQKEAANFVARGMSNYDLERRKKKNGF